ncbi:hypothetical protein KI615_20035 [Dechloromonas denitrificans]|nr:hypothetical protein KI615_20035 [Dechloromonas denitrificans]
MLILGASMNAQAGLFGFGGTNWQEEVLLHDGRSIVVERHSSRGGRREIGHGTPIMEQSVSFTVPGSNRPIVWKTEYSQDVGRANLELLAVHILNGTAYIVAQPNLCLAYNKWGRPNPPYVFFKHDGRNWQRISLGELPIEFKELNVSIVIDDPDLFDAIDHYKVIPAKVIKELNRGVTGPQFKSILREPLIIKDPRWCPEMIRTGDGWLGVGWFKDQPSYEACANYCIKEKVLAEVCPCDRFFHKEGK